VTALCNGKPPGLEYGRGSGILSKRPGRDCGACRITSPDLNPIEQAFAKIKHWMRQARVTDVEETWRHLGYLVSTIGPDECADYFKNAGYGSVKT